MLRKLSGGPAVDLQMQRGSSGQGFFGSDPIVVAPFGWVSPLWVPFAQP
jgi:hypothetical protein